MDIDVRHEYLQSQRGLVNPLKGSDIKSAK